VLIIICLVLRTKRDVPLYKESILNVEMKIVNSNFISLFLQRSEVGVNFYLYNFCILFSNKWTILRLVMNRFLVVQSNGSSHMQEINEKQLQ